jgi:hypothetical protein
VSELEHQTAVADGYLLLRLPRRGVLLRVALRFSPRLRALLAGVPLPAKANLLTRWERRADREAGYVRLPSPLADDVLTA